MLSFFFFCCFFIVLCNFSTICRSLLLLVPPLHSSVFGWGICIINCQKCHKKRNIFVHTAVHTFRSLFVFAIADAAGEGPFSCGRTLTFSWFSVISFHCTSGSSSFFLGGFSLCDAVDLNPQEPRPSSFTQSEREFLMIFRPKLSA